MNFFEISDKIIELIGEKNDKEWKNTNNEIKKML